MLTVIIGRRRQGKSTLALALAKSSRRSVIVFDPNDQYGHLKQIDDIGTWMETSGPGSIGRLLATNPVWDWEYLVEELDAGVWKWSEYTLVIDECSMLMNASKVHPALERYARTSPQDVDVILTTHRNVDVNTLFRALATDWFIFNQHLDRDVQTIADNYGADVAEASKGLPKYHLIHFWLDKGGQPFWQIWNRPQDWFVDIGRKT